MAPRRSVLAIASWLALVAGCGRSPVLLFGQGAASGGGEGGDEGEEPPLPRCGDGPEDVFAQVVVGYDPTAGGSAFPLREDVVDPEAALGPPDHRPTPPLGTVSIGDGGTLTVSFEPCTIGTDLQSGLDLVVHEAGFDEQTTVELRPTAAARPWLEPRLDVDGFLRLPLQPGVVGGFDADEVLAGIPEEGRRFDAVRIRDLPGQGLETAETPGADVDAVEITVPLPTE